MIKQKVNESTKTFKKVKHFCASKSCTTVGNREIHKLSKLDIENQDQLIIHSVIGGVEIFWCPYQQNIVHKICTIAGKKEKSKNLNAQRSSDALTLCKSN